MKNFTAVGDIIDITAPAGGLTAGQAYVAGTIPVVPLGDIAEGETGSARRTGVFSFAVKGVNDAGSVAVAFGDDIYLDGAELNKDAANGVAFGKALGAVGSGTTTFIDVLVA